MLNYRFRRRLCVELFRVIFIVDVVANADKFSPVVATSEENDRDTKYFRSRNPLQVRRIGFEDEFIHSNRNGADKK
jgi:hypothetical protein